MAKKNFEETKSQISQEASTLFQGLLAMDLDDAELTEVATYNEENEVKHIEILEEIKEQPKPAKPSETATESNKAKDKEVIAVTEAVPEAVPEKTEVSKEEPVETETPKIEPIEIEAPSKEEPIETKAPKKEPAEAKKPSPKKPKPKAETPDIPTSLLGALAAPTYPRFINKESGEIFELTKNVVVLGRKESEVDIVIDSKYVSRQHVKFIVNNDKYFISDLESSNGTYLNGDRLPAKTMFEIRDGNEIKIANEAFEFDSNKRKDK